jgi:hypothetical protein
MNLLISVPEEDKPDISFHGDVLAHGFRQYLTASSQQIAGKSPGRSAMHLEVFLEWFGLHVLLLFIS